MEEQPLIFDDSSVARYVCDLLSEAAAGSNVSSSAGSSWLADPGPGHEVAGFAKLPGCLYDPAQAQAYSVDHRPGLVLAGGKGGVVSIWGSRHLEAGSLPADEEVMPLLSHKLHKGW